MQARSSVVEFGRESSGTQVPLLRRGVLEPADYAQEMAFLSPDRMADQSVQSTTRRFIVHDTVFGAESVATLPTTTTRPSQYLVFRRRRRTATPCLSRSGSEVLSLTRSNCGPARTPGTIGYALSLILRLDPMQLSAQRAEHAHFIFLLPHVLRFCRHGHSGNRSRHFPRSGKTQGYWRRRTTPPGPSRSKQLCRRTHFRRPVPPVI